MIDDSENQDIRKILKFALPHDFGRTLTYIDRKTRDIVKNTSGTGCLVDYAKRANVNFNKRTTSILRVVDDIEANFDMFWEDNLNVDSLASIESLYESAFLDKFSTIEESVTTISRLLDRMSGDRFVGRQLLTNADLSNCMSECYESVDSILYFSNRSKHYVKGMVELVTLMSTREIEYTNLNKFFSSQNDFLTFEVANTRIEICNWLPTLKMDTSHVYSLVSNIVKNSSKYRRKPSCSVLVLFESTKFSKENIQRSIPSYVPLGQVRENHSSLHIVDYGIGIQEQKLRSVFRPFRRGLSIEEEKLLSIREKSLLAKRGVSLSNYEYSGMGIGLAIAERVVKMYGGNIFATSSLGEGTCMTIELPNSVIVGSKEKNNDR